MTPQDRRAEEKRLGEIIYLNRAEPGMVAMRKLLEIQMCKQQETLLVCHADEFSEHRALAVATQKMLRLLTDKIQ